jgi:DHA2 family multidrug resistance protein-like MFS transporter
VAQVRPLGALLSGVAMTALAWTLIGLPVKGLADPGTLTGMGVAVASLVAFVAWEAGTPSLMLPLGLIAASTVAATLGQRLGNRPLAAAGLTVVAAGFGLLATLSPGDGFVATALALFGAGAGLPSRRRSRR